MLSFCDKGLVGATFQMEETSEEALVAITQVAINFHLEEKLCKNTLSIQRVGPYFHKATGANG